MAKIVQFHLEEIRQLLEEEPGIYSISELSDRFDIGEETIRKFVEGNGLRVNEWRNPKRKEIVEFMKGNTRLTAKLIALKLNEDPVYISNLARRIGIELRGMYIRRNSKVDLFDYKKDGLAY